MSNIAELHILKTHIQELEQDVRISLSRQEIKLHDTCASREQIAALKAQVEMTTREKPEMIQLIRQQAAEGDPVCAELLSLIALNHVQGGGYSWIETQLDMEVEE